MPLLPRRKVLKWSLATGVLALGGGIALAAQKPKLRESTPALKVLDAGTYATLAALADVLCPALGPGAPGASALGTAQRIDEMLAAAPNDAQEGFKGALGMLENALGGALFGERITPFTKLDPKAQDEAFANMRDSSVGVRRTLFRALSVLVWAAYWSDPRTWQRIGYNDVRTTESLREMYRDNLVDLDSLRASPLAQGG